ncbi:nitrilase-related carbon-nitrogen hydrolase [Henriciella sp. AS95]|uniref:nitrilase-related carbon-nitrogen hydrolase n=1 Tax=Henriciella sp. AS95 TaxID=3135782 RepID=UPI0031774703
MLSEHLHVGVIQTSLNAEAAWVDNSDGNWQNCLKMAHYEELRAKREIRHFLASLRAQGALRERVKDGSSQEIQNSDPSPDIILLPELAVPLGFEKQLRRAAEQLEAIIIAGMDYRIVDGAPEPMVLNEALVIVPRRLNGKQVSRQTSVRRVGKTYPAPAEDKKLKRIVGGPVSFKSHPTVWIFESNDLGKFGVAICYDFMDLDRVVMYRNKIQTLFILAYNRDTTSFDHMAEALSRTLFCNVVVCNCGQFGGSLAVSPFREPFRRLIYRHSGQELSNAQIVKLPLWALSDGQKGNAQPELKSLPPGFEENKELTPKNVTI